jgi:thymidylate kinase
MINYPKIIELFGLPRTGKTTTARALCKYYSDKGIKVHLIQERASVCPVKNKLSPLFNLWTMAAYLKEYIEATENNCSLVISDRGLIDALIWINSFNESNKYQEELQLVSSLLDFELIKKNILLSVFFYADIGTVLEREYGKLAKNRVGRVINNKVLNNYLESSKLVCNKLPIPIKEIDTSQISLSETLEIMVNELQKFELSNCT